MLKKAIKYTDFDGNVREEDFYFNLTKAELVELNMGVTGGLEKLINRIVSEQDSKKIIEMFKEIILKSYGVKSPDGKKFVKNDEVVEDFKSTEAYSELFMELATDADAAAKFINGIVPQDVREEVEKQNLKALPSNS